MLHKFDKLKRTFPALKKKSLKYLLRHLKKNSIKKIKIHFNSKEIFTFSEFQETEIIKKQKTKLVLSKTFICTI